MDKNLALEELNKFEIVQCGLRHEDIRYDQKSGIPQKRFVGETVYYERNNLCDSSLRKIRLGCAHAPSNIHFNELVKSVAAGNEQIGEQLETFDDLITQIYALDHEKGEWDKKRANCREMEQVPKAEMEKIEAHLSGVDVRHRLLIDQLTQIKKDLLQSITRLA